MPRYIDADKLIDLATHEGAYGYVDVHDILNIPTADVVERKKGIWFPRNNAFQKWFRCSECAYRLHELKGTKFCPNCGADMRENGNETN